MYLMHYCISHVFGSCQLLPTAPPLPLHPLFHVLCHRCRGYCARYFQSPLLALSPINPLPRSLQRIHAEVQNSLHHNLLSYLILPLEEIFSHPLDTRFLHLCLQRWVIPAPILLLLWLTPCNLPGEPVLETPQIPFYARGQHPSPKPEYNNRLYHCLEENPQYLWSGALPSQYPLHLCPYLSRLPKVPCQHWTVVICHYQDPPQVFEQGDRCKRPHVSLKILLRALLCPLFFQLPSLPFLPLGTMSGGNMPPVLSLPGH